MPPLVVAFAIAGAVVTLFSVVIPQLPTRELELRVDLSASAGSRVSLFLNDFTDPPQSVQLHPGSRRVYAFELREGAIDRIRIDLVDALGAEIRYYRVEVLEDGQIVAEFPAFDLSTWSVYYASDPTVEEGAFRLTATGPGPSIAGLRTVTARSTLPGLLEPIAEAVKEADGLLRVGLLGLGLGAALLGLLSMKGRWTLTLGAVTVAAAVLALDLTLRNPGGLASAASELGRATYVGLSLPTNVLAVWVLYGYAIVLGLAAAFLFWWRSRATRGTPTASDGSTSRTSWAAWLAAGIAALAAIAVCAPDLHAGVLEATDGRYPTGWDAENLLAWAEFTDRGLTPMRDFWYPYGNLVVFESGLVTGAVVFSVYKLALYAGSWWIFWIAAGRRLFASSLALLALLAAEPILSQFNRYAPAIVIALAYTCIDPDGPPRLRLVSRVVFGALFAIGVFLDPILIAYAAVGIGSALIVDVIRAWRRGLHWWARRLASDFALPSVGLAAAAALAVVRGQLHGMLDLYLTLSGSSIYSATPTELMDGLRSALDASVVILWIPVVLVAVGLFARLSTPSTVLTHGLASRLLVIGMTAAPALLKHAARSTSMLLLLFVTVGLILVLLWASARQRAWPAIAVLAGLGLSVTLAYPGPDHVIDSVRALPSRIAYGLGLPFDSGELRRARAERFSDERFAGHVQELAVAADLRARPDLEDDTDLFVLGDAPVLYILLRQRPPWQIVPYNTSPLTEQRRVVDWLAEQSPTIVVVDRTTQVFDSVPHDVRVPLLFQYVIGHYEFDHAVGPYDVLVRRPPDLDATTNYWSQLLGGDVGLGSTPNVSSYDELEPCGPDVETCGAFLVVEALRTDATSGVEIPLSFGGHKILVHFEAENSRTYTLPLARTWPWALSTDVRLAGRPTKGWAAHIVRGEQPPDTLY